MSLFSVAGRYAMTESTYKLMSSSESPTIALLVGALDQRFSTPVLAPPRSAHFVCFSLHFRPLFYSTVSALRSGLHRIFRHHSSSK